MFVYVEAFPSVEGDGMLSGAMVAVCVCLGGFVGGPLKEVLRVCMAFHGDEKFKKCEKTHGKLPSSHEGS